MNWCWFNCFGFNPIPSKIDDFFNAKKKCIFILFVLTVDHVAGFYNFVNFLWFSTTSLKLAFKRLNSHKRLNFSTSPRFVAFSPIAFEKTSLSEAKRCFRLSRKWLKCLNPIGAFRKIYTSNWGRNKTYNFTPSVDFGLNLFLYRDSRSRNTQK